MASGLGADVEPGDGPLHARLFGEDQARYVLAVSSVDAEGVLSAADGVPVRRLGTVGGNTLRAGPLVVEVTDMTIAHESWFPRFMAGTLPETAATAA